MLRCAPAMGVRETRRIVGKYRISDEDIISKAMFEDSITVGSFGVDVHEITARPPRAIMKNRSMRFRWPAVSP